MDQSPLILFAEFGQVDIPLDRVAERYLGLTPKVAMQWARCSDLPFPAYRASGGQVLWLVRVIDRARQQAVADWATRNTTHTQEPPTC